MHSIDPRLLQAIWRWRTRRILRAATLRQKQAARLLPAFLHAHFNHPDLQGEPPGVDGILAPRGWAMLARVFNVPPPLSAHRGRKLVRAVVVLPGSDGVLDLVVVPSGLLGELETERLNQRLIASEKLLKRGGAEVRVRIFSPEVDSLPLFAFGGKVAGLLDEADLGPEAVAVPGAGVSQGLVSEAPTALAALCNLLLVGRWSQSVTGWIQTLHDEGIGATLLSDPEFFAGVVAARDGEAGGLPMQAVSHGAGDALVREAARRFVPKEPPPSVPTRSRRPQAPSPHAALLQLGRDLALAAARTVRRAPAAESQAARARLRSEVLAPGVPVALIPALQRVGSAGGPGRRLDPPREGQEQAFARRLAIAVRTGLRGATDDLDPIWRRAGALMAGPIDGPILLISVEGREVAGPPMDPLNRGEQREVALVPPLVISLRPDGRPTARRMPAAEAIVRLVTESHKGTAVEVVGMSGAAQPAVSRLVRLAQLAKVGSDEVPLAVEIGGRVVLLGGEVRVGAGVGAGNALSAASGLVPGAGSGAADGAGIRSFSVKRFAARPRLYIADPESPDLAPQVPTRGGAQRRLGVSVDCLVSPLEGGRAAILYTDTEGYHLREEVPLALLEEHLQEAQVILRGAPSPTLLAVRTAGQLEAALSRQSAPTRRIEVQVEGDLVYGLRLRMMGETFGSGERWGWRAAAVAILSVWPGPDAGRIAVRVGTLDVAGEQADGLVRLYARSVVQRRLGAHLGRAGAFKLPAAAGEKST